MTTDEVEELVACPVCGFPFSNGRDSRENTWTDCHISGCPLSQSPPSEEQK
jgi:hypothetical protein